MRIRHYALLLSSLCLVVASTSFASQRSALRQSIAPNGTKTLDEKLWNPMAGHATVLADVPETEPNDTLDDADKIDCGDNYRPAFINVPDDIDVLSISLTAGDLITFGTNADGTVGQIGDTIIGIFDDLGNLLDSDDDSGPGFYSLLTDFPAPYTGDYFLAVIAFDINDIGQYQAFVRCTAAPDPPANDTCAGAIRLDCKDFDVSGTTAGANNDYTPTSVPAAGCTGFTAAGADVVYLVLLPDGGSISLDYTSTADGSVYLLNACVSPADAACVAGADATFTGELEHLNYTNSSGGSQTLYLILDNFGTGAFGTYTLTGTMTCPPVPTEVTSWGTIKALYNH